MDSEILQQFIRQTESRLSSIRGNILVCLQHGNSCTELNASLRQTRLVKNSASELGLNEIRRGAELLEEEIESLVTLKNPLSDAESRNLLDKLAILEAVLTQITFRIDFFPDDITGFIEESFDNLQIKTPETKDLETVETSEEAEEEFEIDDEMLEVFAAEADELLQNINLNLKILDKTPKNREALLEIRRSAHTLKGSAGIVGMKKLSDLAHRVEDLLDYLAENEFEADERILKLLLTSTDCFGSLASNESSAQLSKKIARLYKNFDEILAPSKNKKEPKSENSEPQTEEPQEKTTKDEEQAVEALATNPQSENPNPKSVVRVSLEKLDEVIQIVGDLAVSRSAFERLLSEFDRQNQELRNNTNRLQRSTGKLESEFDADMMQTPDYKLQITNSGIVRTNSTDAVKTDAFFPESDFDTLEFDRYTEFHQTTRELVETAADNYTVNNEFDALRDKLEILFDAQRRLIEELQEKLVHLRLVKFGVLSPRFQRVVRVTCEEEGKLADLFIEGDNHEFDTQILDSLAEPVLHLLRNAVAHGIETPETRRLLGKEERGKIFLRIQSEGTHLNLTISDDGRGVSTSALIEKAVLHKFIAPEEAEKMSEDEAFSLMFLPGLTTADKLSQIAGRGVGMNIVKTNIERHQGTISIKSEAQKGTTVSVRLPLTLALTRSLIVKIGGQTFAFPSKLIKRVMEIHLPSSENQARPPSAQIDNQTHSILYLDEILNLPPIKRGSEFVPVLEVLENPSVLAVDEIVGIEEIVIKPLGVPLKNSPEFLGAAILGDGQAVPVLDLIYLLKHKTRGHKKIQDSALESQSKIKNQKSKILSVLIVDDSPTVRQLTSNLIKSAGWQPIAAKDGLEALEILQAFQELPDIILTDVEMPRMNGYELLSALKNEENLRDIPVVMITSRAAEKHRQKAFELGVLEYLTKPFADSTLLDKIRSLTSSD